MFELDELPYKELAALGLTKETILNLPEKQLSGLLEGRRTDVISFQQVKLADGNILDKLDAQISIIRNSAGQPALSVQPIGKDQQNTYALAEHETHKIPTGQALEPLQEMKAKYKLDELPYQELAPLGITRDTLASLPEKELQNLLEGSRSEFTTFKNVKLADGTTIDALEAQISLQRSSTGQATLAIHPMASNSPMAYENVNTNVIPNRSEDAVSTQSIRQTDPTIPAVATRDTTHKFTLDELPYQQLESLGLTKETIANLPEKQLTNLLEGGRSEITTFTNLKLEGGGSIDVLEAKVSIRTNETGDPSLAIHTIRKEPENVYQLTEQEIKGLVTGKDQVVTKEVIDNLGGKQTVEVKFDKDLNDFYVQNPREIVQQIDLHAPQRKEKEKLEELVEMSVEVEEPKSKLDYMKSILHKTFMFALDGGLSMAIKAMLKYLDKKPDPIAVPVIEADLNKDDNKKSATVLAEQFSSGSKALQPKVELGNAVQQVENSTKVESPVIKTVNVNPKPGIDPLQEVAKKKYPSTLLEHGPAPYNFQEQNKQSYFVRLESKKGESVVWGTDLQRAILESGAQRGDKITLENRGQQTVKVSQDVRDDNGTVLSNKIIDAKRVEWAVDVLSKGTLNDLQLANANNLKLATAGQDNAKKISR